MDTATSIYWPCDKQVFMAGSECDCIQRGVQDLASNSAPWTVARARELVIAIVFARTWESRVTPLRFLLNDLLMQRCGCPVAIATAAVEAVWADAASPFQQMYGGEITKETRCFLHLKNTTTSPLPVKLSKSQQRRERAKKTRAALKNQTS